MLLTAVNSTTYTGCFKNICKKQFSRFQDDHFDMNDYLRSGRPSDKAFKRSSLIHDDPHRSIREFASIIDCDQSTVIHLYCLSRIKKFGLWVLYILNENYKNPCVNVGTQLLVRHRPTSNNIDHFCPILLLVRKNGGIKLTSRTEESGLTLTERQFPKQNWYHVY